MKKRFYRIIISIILFSIGIIFKLNDFKILFFSFLLLSYITVGYDIFYIAFTNIKRKQLFDENFLMSIASLGAICIGEITEGVFVLIFYQIGEFFQDKAVDKSRKNIASLMDIEAESANLIEDGKIIKKNPEDLKIGEMILIKPGERIPIDSVIISGESRIDTSSLTGENIPRKVLKGDEILSGTINLNNIIKAKVIKNYEDSTVSKVLELVESASDRKSKSEKFITKFAKIYTPIVVIVASIIAIFGLFFTKDGFYDYLYRALSFLVISCPCAFVISVPLSFFGGVGGASKRGVLVKGSNFLEELSKVSTIAFDKTGTLTKGVFKVKEISNINISKKDFLKYISYAESGSNHPIAKSILKYSNIEIDTKYIENFEEIAGFGIKAKVFGKEVIIGNEKLLKKENIDFKEEKLKSVIYMAIDKNYTGFLEIDDEIKEDSINTLKELKKLGIKKLIMLTGDEKNSAERIANKLGIDEVYYKLLPQDKVKIIEKLIDNKNDKEKIAFVGDGINDAPSLALSDIGISMGNVGSDAAIEASDVVLMDDELKKIVTAIKISKNTVRIAKENSLFAIFVKFLILILSALGLTSMWAAIFADVGVTIIATLNSFRTLKTEKF
ncbi:MAG: heavy metal translocating P-type ATPase [Peptoniphilaceae bacterium]|nr:heavy metal translocating P-type ATPase [Peptoniphilaceae bacterium]MDY3737546.1 heavy metal translocating P-type ATPase [Peptoniphilaceae bacterium]